HQRRDDRLRLRGEMLADPGFVVAEPICDDHRLPVLGDHRRRIPCRMVQRHREQPEPHGVVSPWVLYFAECNHAQPITVTRLDMLPRTQGRSPGDPGAMPEKPPRAKESRGGQRSSGEVLACRAAQAWAPHRVRGDSDALTRPLESPGRAAHPVGKEETSRTTPNDRPTLTPYH